MTKAQIKFGLALADDIRRVRANNVLPGGVIPLNTSIEAIIRSQQSTGCGYLPAPKEKGAAEATP